MVNENYKVSLSERDRIKKLDWRKKDTILEWAARYDIENDEIVTYKKIVDIQTPQVYKYKELFECYSFLSKNNITGMVDTTESMFNFNKCETQAIRGDESNLKITYKSDLEIIEKAII